MTNELLLPCPFCGGDAYVNDKGTEDETTWCERQVVCGGHANGIAKWNRRAPSPREARLEAALREMAGPRNSMVGHSSTCVKVNDPCCINERARRALEEK